MNSVARSLLALVGLAILGASPPVHSARATGTRSLRPSFVDRTRYDRFAPNAIRRARLTYLMPARIPGRRSVADAGDATRSTTSAYTVRNLNAFIQSSGVLIDPLALNNAGQIVGSSTYGDVNGEIDGYIINPSGSNGPLNSSGPSQYFQAVDFPVSINNNGESAVGFENIFVDDQGSFSQYTYSAFWTFFGPLSNSLSAYGVDDGLVSVNNQNTAISSYSGYVFYPTKGSGFFAISSCPISNFYAKALNDSGLFVGFSQINTTQATVLTLGGCPTVVPNVGGDSSYADFVATNGHMILVTYSAGNGQFDLWSKGRVFPIPLPNDYDASKYHADPIGLNASDVVVGNIIGNNGVPAGAFEYADGKSVDIQTLFPSNSGWMPPFYVTGINDIGEIIGKGYLKNVLTPFELMK